MMDEYNQGWDPDVRHYFWKIMKSVVATATWLLVFITLGLFLRMAYIYDGPDVYNFVFYGLMLGTFPLLLRFLYRTWKKN
jgi:hypothetical protein